MNASQQIDQMIAAITDWRAPLLVGLRQLVHAAEPSITEEWKWGAAVFTKAGNVCAVAAFKNHVKINFFKGAQLADPDGLINSGQQSKQTRAIDFRQGDSLNKPSLQKLIQAAVALQAGK